MAHPKSSDDGFGFEIPITPMLDFTFQLLFFFMIYYNPSALEGQIEMNLPAHSEAPADKILAPPLANDSDVPTLPADLTVVLRTRKNGFNNGIISTITVKTRSGDEPMNPDPAKENDTAVLALRRYLEQVRSTLDNKDDIKIEADSSLAWANVVAVIDVCKASGFKIGFGQPTDFSVQP